MGLPAAWVFLLAVELFVAMGRGFGQTGSTTAASYGPLQENHWPSESIAGPGDSCPRVDGWHPTTWIAYLRRSLHWCPLFPFAGSSASSQTASQTFEPCIGYLDSVPPPSHDTVEGEGLMNRTVCIQLVFFGLEPPFWKIMVTTVIIAQHSTQHRLRMEGGNGCYPESHSDGG